MKIKSALISVFYKDGLEPIVKLLSEQGVTIYSTGGTQSFIEKLGIKKRVSDIPITLQRLEAKVTANSFLFPDISSVGCASVE